MGTLLFLTPIGSCAASWWGSFLLGIGLALLNQCGEHSVHLIPFSLMVPPSVYSGVRHADGGYFSHPSMPPISRETSNKK